MNTSYPGSKGASGVAERIISLMPRHSTYIEGFAGMAAVYRLKRRASTTFLIEKNYSTYVALSPAASPGVVVLQEDFLLWIMQPEQRWLLTPDTLIYLDPPYLRETRTRLLYECEFETPEQHTQLLKLILGLPCRVMISGYYSTLYMEMLASWRVEHFTAGTRGGGREEYVWMNYPWGLALHDTRFLGDGYRERERIRRKKKRWASRLAAMPQDERQAIAEALAGVDRATLEMALEDSGSCTAGDGVG